MTDVPYDVEALRLERLASLQSAMRTHAIDVCVLSNEPNVRYATGATAMPVYSMSTFVRCAVVPQEERRSCSSMRTRCIAPPSARPMSARCAHGSSTMIPRRRRADGRTRHWPRSESSAPRRGVSIRDSAPVTQEARRIKTPQELVLLDVNAALVMDMLAAFEAAISPGISERELLAVLFDVMVRGGGEYLATTTVCSGPNTNP